MLNTVFKDAIINREKTLSILKGPDYEKIIQKAKENWIDYEPQKKDVISAGIDSSFNSTKFQGAELWAVTAVSIKSDGEIIADLHDFGLDTNPVLASLASKMEIDACNMSKLGVIGRGFMFVVVGLVTIIVGSFLLRGNMHMWDKVDPDESKEEK